MITEIAHLHIRPCQSGAFEQAFEKAQKIIASSYGYIQHELQVCVEEKDKYVLIVRWQTLENHTEGFRKSAAYNEWKNLLHHFYQPFPVVEYYKKIY